MAKEESVSGTSYGHGWKTSGFWKARTHMKLIRSTSKFLCSSVLLANKYNKNEPLALFTPFFLCHAHILCKVFWGRDWLCKAAWNPRDTLVPRARGTVHNFKLLLCFDIVMFLRKWFMLCIASCSMISVTGQKCSSHVQQYLGLPDLPVPNSSAGYTLILPSQSIHAHLQNLKGPAKRFLLSIRFLTLVLLIHVLWWANTAVLKPLLLQWLRAK